MLTLLLLYQERLLHCQMYKKLERMLHLRDMAEIVIIDQKKVHIIQTKLFTHNGVHIYIIFIA